MVMAVNAVHPSKAESQMLVTLSGIIMEARPEHSAKAESPIHDTLWGINVFWQPATRTFDSVSMMALQSSRESYLGLSESTLIEIKLIHPEKDLNPIVNTLLGIKIEVRR